MESSQLIKLIADCKTTNRYVRGGNGRVYNVFGFTEDCLLVHECYPSEGKLWFRTLSQLSYREVNAVVERATIYPSPE